MINQWFLLVLICFCSVFSFGQKYSAIIPYQEIIHFMNDMLESDDFAKFEPKRKMLVLSRIIDWQHSSFVRKTKKDSVKAPVPIESGYLFNGIADSVINQANIDYFFEQRQQLQTKRWKTKFVNTRLIRKSYNEKVFKHSYSIPLFSVDKTKAIIYKGFKKNWTTVGLGYYLYHKVNGKWVLLQTLFQLQS